MKRSYLWLLLMLSLPWMAFSQMQESKAERDRRMEWWRDAGFGMFIHWGVYSVPAGIYKGEETKGIGEWIMHSANIPTI